MRDRSAEELIGNGYLASVHDQVDIEALEIGSCWSAPTVETEAPASFDHPAPQSLREALWSRRDGEERDLAGRRVAMVIAFSAERRGG